uniref:DUF676 domain-containing protein n=1 Tax=Steinernema glaseri TaxID=37863 RepID=A0A1I7Y876_9BILA
MESDLHVAGHQRARRTAPGRDRTSHRGHEPPADQNLVSESLELEVRGRMIAHSMGGVIVRAMCGLERMKPLIPQLHTLLTFNSPHCGLLYNQRAANWGIALVQFWKQSQSLEQLCLQDAIDFRDTFLFKLSMNGALGMFKYVLLVGTYQDLYVPGHSALVEQCKAAKRDKSPQGVAYAEVVNNLCESVVSSPKRTTLVRYTVQHSLSHSARAHQMIGRAVHIAAVDDDLFVEKLLTVSALKYFV